MNPATRGLLLVAAAMLSVAATHLFPQLPHPMPSHWLARVENLVAELHRVRRSDRWVPDPRQSTAHRAVYRHPTRLWGDNCIVIGFTPDSHQMYYSRDGASILRYPPPGISHTQAIEIAKANGLQEGLREWHIGFRRSGLQGRPVWGIRNVLEVMNIDPLGGETHGQALG